MKHIETEKTWSILLEAINAPESEKSSERTAAITENDHTADIEKECRGLAKYSDEADMGYGRKTRHELLRMEQNGEIVKSHVFVRLARHFYLQGATDNKDTKQLCDLCYTLHAFLGNQYYYAVQKDIVDKLFSLGRRYSHVYPYQPDAYTRSLAESARYLKELGFLINVEYGTISYSDQTAQALFDLLDKKIASISGNTVLQQILPKYTQYYVEEMDRYLLGRKLDEDRNVPFNLLLQLAAKHMKTKNSHEHIKENDLEEIEKLAYAILDVYDIQGTSGIEYSSLGMDQFPLYLKNEMMFEKICVPRQYSAKFILVSLNHLIRPWFSYANTEYSYQDYYKLAEYVLNKNTQHSLNLPSIKRATGLSNRRIRMILKDISLPITEVNKEFDSLDGKVNLFSKPVISLPSDRYLILDQHFCGIGFFNTAHDLIRRNYPELDRHQGTAVENILKTEMCKKGYRLKYGKYKAKNGLKEGECDLVLDGGHLAFLEIKKKDIASEMDELDDVKLLESMAYGMVKAQKQCFSHENYLKKNHKITFEAEDQEIILSSEKIPAYKISICYPEYAFLTNKMFSMNLLEILLTGEFRSIDPSRQEGLHTLNKLGEKIRNIVSSDGNPINAREISFHSLFCSLQQILTALWWCKDEDEFLEAIREWLYSSDKTLDPYVSLFALKAVPKEKQQVRKAMLDFVEKRKSPTMVIG